MNKKAIIIIGLIVILGFGILLLRNSRQQSQFQTQIDNYQANGAITEGSDVSVDITGFAFQANIIKIRRGTKVTWTNEDAAKHTVTSDGGGILDSPVLDKGASYQKTFNETGVFRYHCDPHPNMLGAIIVVD